MGNFISTATLKFGELSISENGYRKALDFARYQSITKIHAILAEDA